MLPPSALATPFANRPTRAVGYGQHVAERLTWAAELMGWEDRVGAIAPGMNADFIAVEGDPTRDTSLLENVGWVMKGGQIVERHKKFDR